MTTMRTIHERCTGARFALPAAIMLTLAAATAGSQPTGVKPKPTGVDPTAAATRPLASASDYQFDTSKLTAPPPATLPSARLKPGAFAEANIAQAFADKMPEGVSPRKLGGTRTIVLGNEWRIERDAQQGSLLVARHPPDEVEEQETEEPGKARPDARPPEYKPRENTLDDARAKSLSLERLTRFGIPATEVGEVTSLRLVTQDLDAERPGPVELMSYKTVVYRAINGVPVRGHRAVVTHWPDGSLKRTLVHWPAIAETGNRLTTRLSVAEITGRAARVLAREGVPKGSRASLRFRYVPVQQPNGEVTLRLITSARVRAPEKLPEGSFAEPREFEVPVDAQ